MYVLHNKIQHKSHPPLRKTDLSRIEHVRIDAFIVFVIVAERDCNTATGFFLCRRGRSKRVETAAAQWCLLLDDQAELPAREIASNVK
jgi:hypothetical protein